jgi:hypothetical protein
MSRFATGDAIPPLRGHARTALERPGVFLVDAGNTLVDNDAIQQDRKDHLERAFGPASRERYWRILEGLFAELGYRRYIGALQRCRVEHADLHDRDVLQLRAAARPNPS